MHAGDDEQAPLPQQLLRKYIAYARQYCHPRLTDEARLVLQAFYLHLRQQTGQGSSMPVTVRGGRQQTGQGSTMPVTVRLVF